MTTLVAHHLESMWESGLNNYGTSFEEEVNNICDFLIHGGQDIDKIIVTSFENLDWEEGHAPLVETANELGIPIEHKTYGYGMLRNLDCEDSMERYSEENKNITWCYSEREYHEHENNMQDVLDVEDWIVDLKNDDVLLVGAFEEECLLDMETIFENQNINYNKIDDLCVGNGINYEMIGPAIKLDSIEDEVLDVLDEYDYEDFNELIEEKPKVAKSFVDKINNVVEEVKDNLESKKIIIEHIDIDIEIEDKIENDEIKEVVVQLFKDEASDVESDIKNSIKKKIK